MSRTGSEGTVVVIDLPKHVPYVSKRQGSYKVGMVVRVDELNGSNDKWGLSSCSVGDTDKYKNE